MNPEKTQRRTSVNSPCDNPSGEDEKYILAGAELVTSGGMHYSGYCLACDSFWILRAILRRILERGKRIVGNFRKRICWRISRKDCWKKE